MRAAASPAPLFAALADETRLALLLELGQGEPRSIVQLTQSSTLTRQAITKHLRVLEGARLVRCSPSGRERLYSLDPQPVHELRAWLDQIAAQWDEPLARLKSFVERPER